MLNSDQIAKLIVRTALRDRDAFDELYDATSDKLFGICLHVLKDRTDAEDALQDVYIRIWAKADRYAQSALGPMPWLHAVARNLSIDRLRSRNVAGAGGRPIEEAEGKPSEGLSPEAGAVLSSELKRIERCLGEQEPDRADALVKAYLDGYSYQELADEKAVPLNTMRTWLRRGLIALRECLDR